MAVNIIGKYRKAITCKETSMLVDMWNIGLENVVDCPNFSFINRDWKYTALNNRVSYLGKKIAKYLGLDALLGANTFESFEVSNAFHKHKDGEITVMFVLNNRIYEHDHDIAVETTFNLITREVQKLSFYIKNNQCDFEEYYRLRDFEKSYRGSEFVEELQKLILDNNSPHNFDMISVEELKLVGLYCWLKLI